MGTNPSRFERRHALVVGLQFGDEGKGQLVDGLAGDHDVTVRFNGGANAGHSVRIGDERFALHLLPCGVLTAGTLNLLANGVLAGLESLHVCTAYRLDGRRIEAPPADAQALAACEPIYEELEGFSEPVDTVRRYADLPAAARRYVDLVAAHAGPVRRVCVGPSREQMLDVPV